MSIRILAVASLVLVGVAGCAGAGHSAGGRAMLEQDSIGTSQGELKITFVGHGTLMLEFAGKTIHVDPVTCGADYTSMPKADLILVTHHHRDHLDPEAIAGIRKPDTIVLLPEKCASAVPNAIVIREGEVKAVLGLRVEAFPAYNIVHKRPSGEPFHPRGEGNGYVIGFGDKHIYVGGDTENIPEMVRLLGRIDAAFLPMNLPYTMTPAMVADAARAFRPKILYPYHYGETDPAELVRLLAEEKEIEVRIRRMR